MNIFHHVDKPAIIAQKLQRVACNKFHMKPRHYTVKMIFVRVRLQSSDVTSLFDDDYCYVVTPRVTDVSHVENHPQCKSSVLPRLATVCYVAMQDKDYLGKTTHVAKVTRKLKSLTCNEDAMCVGRVTRMLRECYEEVTNLSHVSGVSLACYSRM